MEKKPFVTLEQLQEIEKTYPTPFHIYDEKGFMENARRVNEAFAWNEGFREYFAVKAEPNPFIIKLLKEEGIGVDCSSETELMIAEKLGFTCSCSRCADRLICSILSAYFSKYASNVSLFIACKINNNSPIHKIFREKREGRHPQRTPALTITLPLPGTPPSFGGAGGGLPFFLRRGWGRFLGFRLLATPCQRLDVLERSRLLQHLARQVVQVGAARSEAQVQALDVLSHRELVLRLGTLRGHAQVERAQLAELHLLRLHQLLQDALLQLVGNAQADILAIHRVVLRDVLHQLTIRHRLRGYTLAVPLLVGPRLRVLVLILTIQYTHNFFVVFFMVLNFRCGELHRVTASRLQKLL